MMRKVAVIGVGCVKIGEHWEKSLRDLCFEAFKNALDDAGIEPQMIDGLYIGNMSSGYYQRQEHLGSLIADYLGLIGVPAVKIESACSSAGFTFREAVQAVASGMHEMVAAIGVEKMTEVKTPDATSALIMAADHDYEAEFGVTFVGLNALVKRRYMHDYNVKDEEIAYFSVHCHKYGVNNPHAQYPFPIKLETVMKSPIVADPIRLFECAGIGDGAAVAILCPLEKARELIDEDRIVEVAGIGAATDTIRLADHDSLTSFKATILATKRAISSAKITLKDIDLVEVHDAFSITGIISLEDMGFYKPGQAAKAAVEGELEKDGKLPTNMSGGLKSRGHPVGATGLYQIIEVVQQLRGEFGKNQVEDAQIGAAQNIGGVGGSVTVTILRRFR